MRKLRGFSLIELMIVVAIIGILAAIGYPSYRDYVVRANRSAAQQFLLEVASRQEQHLLNNGAYAGSLAALNLVEPANDVDPFYDVAITLDAGPPPTYTVTATPVAGSMQAGDGNVVLNGDGSRSGNWN